MNIRIFALAGATAVALAACSAPADKSADEAMPADADAMDTGATTSTPPPMDGTATVPPTDMTTPNTPMNPDGTPMNPPPTAPVDPGTTSPTTSPPAQ